MSTATAPGLEDDFVSVAVHLPQSREPWTLISPAAVSAKISRIWEKIII